jgi:quinol-cytochrome oxidoreductase complex cytochrome b subunit
MTGLVLVSQIISGIMLSMHYTPSEAEAFKSINTIMTDVNYGYLLRYVHANGASLMFICLYIHIFKAVFYASYSGKHK